MIHYIKGILQHKSPMLAVIESAGVGWELRIPVSTFETLPVIGNECALYAYLSFSQDDVKIFGFATIAERELFAKLTKVSGIGPKIALSILSTLSINTFIKSVRNAEEGLLTRVPGIGKKSAQRLIVELKDNIHKLLDYVEDNPDLQEGPLEEVENALMALGYNSQAIQRELKMLNADELGLPAEQLIKEVIKRLYQRAK
ncbi:MAG: Holliday junction branch migration protein RuvA [Candidatus Cloacimonetes bacterium]|jgi:Holliday junction DNA helicase RuvA|nr:Holliday junction branch migration protein RuvA [Candidatus Cloacimonadota bacterium]MDY0299112.1 Holliday junction branch migration protein RuvA [Candidatus Cloacimonadaceae bacterium]MCB5278172.1 Holliday junction branch migration protein RuvA [Candidatus Cloacimonadota bacterium]MCK9331830.1 Holliday junction branch migration protein RuvA [Candidatus Cloacimonadota bacterium]MDD3282834.1 Holliday junction branch migration protein RuvA [Candidatus Cloacimonadota bacterium]